MYEEVAKENKKAVDSVLKFKVILDVECKLSEQMDFWKEVEELSDFCELVDKEVKNVK